MVVMFCIIMFLQCNYIPLFLSMTPNLSYTLFVGWKLQGQLCHYYKKQCIICVMFRPTFELSLRQKKKRPSLKNGIMKSPKLSLLMYFFQTFNCNKFSFLNCKLSNVSNLEHLHFSLIFKFYFHSCIKSHNFHL